MPSKTDLSGESLTLDYSDLRRVAGIAEAYTRDRLERYLNEQFHEIGGAVSPVYSDSMLQAASDLNLASRLYYYLVNGADREVITVVKPEVKNAQPGTN